MRSVSILACILGAFCLSFLVLVSLYVVRNLEFDGETLRPKTPAQAKIEDRAPIMDLEPGKGTGPGDDWKAAPQSPASLLKPGGSTLGTGQNRQAAPQSPASVWNHDGSTLRLEVHGRLRRLYYIEHSSGFQAKTGDMAFEGIREGRTFSGRAFQFAEHCPPISYLAKGSISADEQTLRMAGKQPQRDSQCHITGYVDSELVFNLAKRPQQGISLGKREAAGREN